jgi:NADH-quinone oxidoreductase subunit C
VLPEALKQYPAAAALAAKADASVKGGKFEFKELTIDVDDAEIVAVLKVLKNELGWNRLSSITCVDWHPKQAGRFEIVYLLQNTTTWERLRIKAAVDGGTSDKLPEIDSATGVWAGANWYEREIYDMFGVVFRNHPDLKRILMPIDWVGHPLRKDFPVHGYKYSYKSE